MARRRNVAIVGIGQTHHRQRRPDVNQVELVNEAVRAALEDAGLRMGQIEAVLIGNMELFEGNYLVDMWQVDGSGAYLKSGMKITSGGTTGATVAVAADHYVASGLFDTVLAIGYEKQEEGDTNAGLNAVADPLWGRTMASGAIGYFAFMGANYMQQYGATEEQAAKVRVKAARNALKNPYAHLKLSLTVQDVLNSRLLAYPIKLLDMCPTSNGACALILASEERAKRITDKPVWIMDTVTCHNEGYFGAVREGPSSLETAARKLYQRNGIAHPRKELDLIELYEPSTWAELIWYEYLFLCERGEGGKLIEQGATDLEGDIPVNPSGGVLSTNPIGATAMIRIAEAALQLRGDAGERQVAKAERALATAFGGSFWTVLTLLQKKLP